MKQFKKLSRFTAAFLSLLTAFSIVPTATITASAQTIHETNASLDSKEVKSNVFLDALGYLGYKVNDPNMFSTKGSYGDDNTKNWFRTHRVNLRSSVYYDLDCALTGTETTSGKPDVSTFKSEGLCCASYVSYVFFNYLKNVRNVDLVSQGTLSAPDNYTSTSSWDTMLEKKAIAGKIEVVPFNSNTPAGSFDVGDILVFKVNGEYSHIAIYAGWYNGRHWINHCGGATITDNGKSYSMGPTIDPASTIGNTKLQIDYGVSKGEIVSAYRIKEYEQFGGISVKKVDKDTEEALEGAIFKVTSKETNNSIYIESKTDGWATTGKVLKPGKYTVVETQAPPNYELSGQTEEVTVEPDKITEYPVYFKNEKQEGKLRFTKIVDKDTTMTQDETFDFNIYEGRTATGTPVQSFTATISATDKKLSKIKNMTGFVNTDTTTGEKYAEWTLDVGTYTVEEVLTSEQLQAGYVKQSTQTIEVTKDTTATVSFENRKVLGSLNIIKKAEGAEKADGFKFAIMKIQNGEVTGFYEDVTDENGNITFADVITASEVAGAAGSNIEFRLIEIKTNKNYLLPAPSVIENYGKNDQKITTTGYVGAFYHGTAAEPKKSDVYFQDGGSFFDAWVNTWEEDGNELGSNNQQKVNGLQIINDNGIYYIVTGQGKYSQYDIAVSYPINSFKVSDVRDMVVSKKSSFVFEIDNKIQKGKINIHKTGEVFTGVTETETINGLTLKQLKFEEKNLKDVKFKITAAENIIVNRNIVHNAGDYITTVTTDANGEATIDNLFLGKYTITEVYTPDGHITAEPQTVTLTATDNTTEVFEKNVDFYNDKVDAAVSVTKVMKEININGVTHGNKNEIQNVVFGLYANENINSHTGRRLISKNDLIDVQLVSTDNKTFKFTADLPIGKYYIKEIKTDNNYLIDNTKYAFEFSPTDNTTKTIKIDLGTIINTPKGDIVGVKKDLYGKVIAGAKFQLYAQNAIYNENLDVEYEANEPIGSEVTSDANGKFSWSGLYHGSYYIKETYTPTPYVLPIEAVASDIYINVENTVQTVNISNTHKVGQIKIIKTANQFTGVTSTTSDGKTVYTPTYTTKGLAGVKFDIYAAEDIYLNGNKIVNNGYKIQSDLETDANGEVTSIELLLGKYRIVETYAPGGYVKSADQYVEVKNDTNARVATTTKTIFNERATAQAEVVKIMQFVEKHGIIHGNKGEIKNVTLGLYANETITATNGQSIPKDGLIEMQKVDVTTNTATFNFTKDIPFGSYYIQEIATDGAYFLNGVKREFTFKPTSDNTQKNNKFRLESITNYAKGDIVGVKKNKEGQLVEGCKFKLYDSQGNQVQNEVTSDKNGKFGWSGLDYGTYYIKETYVPDGYILPTLAVKTNINISQTNTVGYAEVTNQKTKIEFLKTDENGKPLANAEFALYKGKTATGTPIATWTSTTSAKVFEGLAKGDYTIKETKAPDGYVLLKELVHFTVDNNSTQDNPLKVGATNKPTRVEFLKTDEKGKPLANAEFALYKGKTATGTPIATWTSTTSAKVFEGLAYGEYCIVETKSPVGFALLPGVIEFTVDDEDKVIEVSAMDDKLAEVFSGGPGKVIFYVIGGSMVGLGIFSIVFPALKLKRNKREED